MAQQLDYTPPSYPPGQDAFTAQDDLNRLVETLHEAGALRAAHDFAARFQDVLGVFLPMLDTEEGRNAITNLLGLGKLLGRLDADGVKRFTEALAEALDDTGARLEQKRGEDPPGFIALTKRLHEEEVRRGLDAVVTLLGSLGARLGEGYRAGASPLGD